MKKVWGLLAVGALAVGVHACGLESVVDDIANDLEKAAEQAKVEAAFGKAITGVTYASLDAALDAAADQVPHGAPAFSPLAESESASVETTTTDKDGNVVTIKGTATATSTSTGATVEVNLTATWSGTIINEDGTTVPASAESTVTGTVTIEKTAEGDVVSLEFANQGTILIEGTSYPFSVTVTWDSTSNSLAISGNVNGVDKTGQSFTVAIPVTVDDEEESNVYGSCVGSEGESCHEYSGAYFSSWDTSSICQELGMTKQFAACDRTGFAGGCTLNAGTDTEETRFMINLDEATCTGELGGIWVPNN